MEYSRIVAGRMQLDDYVDLVPMVYGSPDGQRSIWDVLCHMLHHAAAIGEAIRKESPSKKLFIELADCALWLFTLVHKLRGEFAELKPPEKGPPETLIRIRSGCSDLLWHKYPWLCPYCYIRRTVAEREKGTNAGPFDRCDCPVSGALLVNVDIPSKIEALAALRKFSEEQIDKKPKSIDEWQQMFGHIFGSNLKILSLKDIALHFMEELGEVSDAMIRMYTYKEENFLRGQPDIRQLRLEAQLADAFSWLFALSEKADLLRNGGLLPVTEPVRLSQIVWDRYGSNALGSFWCPFCEKVRCSCPLIFVPATRSLEEFKRLL